MPRAFTPRERDHIRGALLEAARERGVRGGFRRLPVEDLCRAVGISKGAFYRFFPTREALFLELLEGTERALRSQLLAAASAPAPLAAVLDTLFAEVPENPLLHALADPEEWAWLERLLPPGFLSEARADDHAFAGELLGILHRSGAVRAGVDPAEWVGLGAILLSLASQRRLVGEATYAGALRMLRRTVEGDWNVG